MGKKFEGENLTMSDIVNAYVKMGLGHLLGNRGEHTVFEKERHLTSESIEIVCVPGRFDTSSLQALLRDAGMLPRTPAQAA